MNERKTEQGKLRIKHSALSVHLSEGRLQQGQVQVQMLGNYLCIQPSLFSPVGLYHFGLYGYLDKQRWTIWQMDRSGEPLGGAPGRRQLWDHRQSIRIKPCCVFSILACVGSLWENISHNSSTQHLCSHHGKGRKRAFQAKTHSILPGKKNIVSLQL